jgi:hypothetical protein
MGNPTAIVKWKGTTHLQLTPTMQKNGPSGEVSHREIMSALPAKIYRKELYVSAEPNRSKNTRNFVSIDSFNSPGGNTVVASAPGNTICFDQSNGATIDMNIPNNRCERNDCESVATSTANNALRRVRSSGMMRPKYDETKSYNPIMYCTNSKQYLEQRNKTFAQNAFHYTRVGAPSLISTPNPTDMINRYSPGGLLHCPKLHIVSPVNPSGNNDGFMEYIWIDKLVSDDSFPYDNPPEEGDPVGNHSPATYQIYFKTGYYTIEDLNQTIHSAMTANKHYFIDKSNGSKAYLINVIYNIYTQKIELQCLSSLLFPADKYDIPTFIEGDELEWVRPSYTVENVIYEGICPVLFVPNNNMSGIIGFAPGYYPDVSPWLKDTVYNPNTDAWMNSFPRFPVDDRRGLGTAPCVVQTHYATLSTLPFRVFPIYKPVEYNPNNTRFAQQGAVSSSNRTLRQKYDQITSNGSTYITPYNSATANALAYSTRESSYSEKAMLGYPGKKTTVYCPSSGEMKCVDILRTKRNMP